MTLYILKEIIEKWVGPEEINILEISENKQILLELRNQYENELKLIRERKSRAIEIERIIHTKTLSEFPNPELLIQEELPPFSRGSITKQQQQIRSKIGTLNATKIQKNLQARNKLHKEEIEKLSEYEKEWLKYLHLDIDPVEYVVEEFESKKPCFSEE